MARIRITTDEQRAACAAQWCCGRKQREIGADFGHKGSVEVCVAILTFLRKYGNPSLNGWTNGNDRKRLVPAAVAEYVRRGGRKPRLRLRAGSARR